jgi:hypothetical protein
MVGRGGSVFVGGIGVKVVVVTDGATVIEVDTGSFIGDIDTDLAGAEQPETTKQIIMRNFHVLKCIKNLVMQPLIHARRLAVH